MTSLVIETELRKRIVTAGLGAALILLLALVGGRTGLALIAVVIALGMINEFVEIIFHLSDKVEKRMILLGTTWLLHFTGYWMPHGEYELLILTFLGLFTYYLFTAGRHQGTEFSDHFKEFTFAIFGLVYLCFIPMFLPLLYNATAGSLWAIYFLLVVWVTDTGAYFAGKKYGKVKLYPLISPNKTREGAIGGLAASWVIALFFKLIVFRSMPWGAVFFVPLLVSPVSQVGDLCESFFKRAFDVKDSGSILPGHGGFLDRFDGVLFGLPVMYLCFRVFG